MKFSVLALLAAATATATASAQLVYRDLQEVTDIITNVNSDIADLDKAVNAFSGDAKPVTSAAEKLVATLKDGKTKVDATSDLSTTDALGLQDPVMKLQTGGRQLAKDLKAKKSAIEDAGLCEMTLEQVTNINSASQDLVKASISKIPQGIQSIAEELSSGLKQELQDTQDEFSKGNCTDKSGGGAGGNGTAASGSPTPTGASTAASPSGTSNAMALAPAGAGVLAVVFAAFLL